MIITQQTKRSNCTQKTSCWGKKETLSTNKNLIITFEKKFIKTFIYNVLFYCCETWLTIESYERDRDRKRCRCD